MKVMLMDMGSTFVKYAVCDDRGGEFVLNGKIPFPEPFDAEHFIVNRGEIETAVKAVMSIAAESGCKRALISVQMHGYLLRYITGEVSDYFSWRGGGGDTESRELINIDFSLRGTKLKGNLPIARLYREKEVLAGAELFTLGSYVAYLLTGNNITHKTDACASGFFGIDGKADSATVPDLILPELADSVEVCGCYCGMQIFTPVGDHAASVYGSGIDENTYLLNIGTASQIAFVGEGEAPSDNWEKRPYFESGKTLFTMGNLFCGLYEDKVSYCAEAAKLMNSLPKKSRILIGGGGAGDIAESLAAAFETPCIFSGGCIGLEGLRIIARNKRLRLGIMLSEAPFVNFPLIVKNSGLDFLMIDNEHGIFDYTFLAELLTVSRLADVAAIVRLPDNSRAWITKCVDAGAGGFLLPMTDTADDIKKVIDYAKYAPIGKRGISTMRAHTLYAPPRLCDYMTAANERVKVYAQIETVKGLESIEEILSVNGVDGVFIGPNDLACDMGCIGDTGPVKAAIERVGASAKKAGKPFGIITASSELIEKALASGASMISCGSELNLLQKGCADIRRALG